MKNKTFELKVLENAFRKTLKILMMLFLFWFFSTAIVKLYEAQTIIPTENKILDNGAYQVPTQRPIICELFISCKVLNKKTKKEANHE